MISADGDHKWQILDGIAWVAEGDRVALIDTTSSASAPMHVEGQAASLWLALGDGPLSLQELRAAADEIVDGDSAGFVRACLETFLEADLVVPLVES